MWGIIFFLFISDVEAKDKRADVITCFVCDSSEPLAPTLTACADELLYDFHQRYLRECGYEHDSCVTYLTVAKGW